MTELKEKLSYQLMIKVFIIIDNGQMSELKLIESFRELYKSGIEVTFMVKVGDDKLQIITLNQFKNYSLEYHQDVASFDQLFYDKGINRWTINASFHHDPPFSFISENGSGHGSSVKFLNLLCVYINTTLTDTSYTEITLSYQIPMYIFYDASTNYPYPYEFLQYCVLVPKAKVLSRLWAMVNALEFSLLMCVPVFIFLSGIFWYYIVKGTSYQRSFYDIYFLLYGMLITNSTHIPLQSKTERIFCLSFIILCFYLLFGFNCKLTALLVSPIYAKDLNTLRDLYNMTLIQNDDFSITMMEHLRTKVELYNFGKFNKTFLQQLCTEVILQFCPECIQVVRCESANKFIKSPENFKNGVIQYHIVEEEVASRLKAFFLRKRSPLLKHINLLMGKLFESGIWQFWASERPFQAVEAKAREKVVEDQENGFIQIETILEFWKIFAVGYGLALIAFLGEIIHFRMKRYWQRKM